jgi:hypothetical protein
LPVADPDDAFPAVGFDDELMEVRRLSPVERFERDIVKNQGVERGHARISASSVVSRRAARRWV